MTGPTKRELERRVDALDGSDGDVDEIPVTVLLSAGPETCVDDERCLHEIGGQTWQFPQRLHDAVMGRRDDGAVVEYLTTGLIGGGDDR
jgi:hypothetical protein